MRLLQLFILVLSSIVLSSCSFISKPKYAGIQVITSDVNSAVFLDNQHLNNTPLNEKEIRPGQYSLKIVPENPLLAPYETSVTLREGLLTVVTWKPAERPEQSGGVIYEMEPLNDRTTSEVSFVTIPDGAIVSFEGKERTFSPTILTDISPGHHEYELTLPSYETQKHTINVIAGYRMIIRAKLAKAAAQNENTVAENTDATMSAMLESEQATQSATTSARMDVLQVARPAASSESATGVQIKNTGFFVNGEEMLRVRDAAGASGKELGFVAVGETLPYLKETRSGWHKISFQTGSGWVSAEFTQLVE